MGTDSSFTPHVSSMTEKYWVITWSKDVRGFVSTRLLAHYLGISRHVVEGALSRARRYKKVKAQVMTGTGKTYIYLYKPEVVDTWKPAQAEYSVREGMLITRPVVHGLGLYRYVDSLTEAADEIRR